MQADTMPAPVQPDSPGAKRYWNPYLAGIGLGLMASRLGRLASNAAGLSVAAAGIAMAAGLL